MSLGNTLLISTIIIFQSSIILLYIFQNKKIYFLKQRYVTVSLFLSIQLIFAFLLVTNKYITLTLRTNEITQILTNRDNPTPVEQFATEGDLALLQQILQQQSTSGRPNLSSISDFNNWQHSLRTLMIKEVFKVLNISSTTNPEFHIISRTNVSESTIKRTFLAFVSFDGTHIPAYLFTPRHNNRNRYPALIVLHGHIPLNSQGITQTAGLTESYHNGVALAFAKAGYIVLTIEFRGFGYLGPPDYPDHNRIAYNAILAGSFYKAILIKDVKYAFDFLLSLDNIDSQRIGITGVSYGGEIAITYAALDQRVKAVVFQGYGGSTGPQLGINSNKEEPRHYCHIIPGHNTYMRQEDIFLLITPRPMLGIRGHLDYTKNENFIKTIRQSYHLLRQPLSFRFEILNGGHEYFIQPAVQFFDRHL